MKERGVYAYLKHFALNDQETYREGVCTWANEQSIREIYLKPYQIVVEDRSAECVMTGFNRLGVLWTGNHGFLNTVFHGEWGSRGIAVSDWWTGSYMNHVGGIYNGNDIPDGTSVISSWNNYKENHPAFAWAMRESAHRILYTVAHSNAMNGLSSNTEVITLTPPWIGKLNTAKTAVDTVFYVAAGFFLVSVVLYFTIGRKKEI
jgi:beta-glucosidase